MIQIPLTCPICGNFLKLHRWLLSCATYPPYTKNNIPIHDLLYKNPIFDEKANCYYSDNVELFLLGYQILQSYIEDNIITKVLIDKQYNNIMTVDFDIINTNAMEFIKNLEIIK